MKSTRWAAAGTMTAALGLALTFAAGAHAGPKGKGGTPAERVERIFTKADANRDGFLTADEVDQRKWRRVSRADADADAKVSKAELTSAMEARRAKAAEHFAKRDKNGDGAVSKAEVNERAWSRLSRADANADGKVTRAEFAKAREDGKLRGKRRGPGKAHGRHE